MTASPLAATVVSMTGFARGVESSEDVAWSWEIKSVNARGLDIRVRLPAGMDQLEPAVRDAIARGCARGTLNATLDLKRTTAPQGLWINQAALDRLLALQAELGDRVDQAPPRLDALLALRGLIEDTEPDTALAAADLAEGGGLRIALLASLQSVLDQLLAVRRAEGAKLAALLESHVATIERLTEEAARAAAMQPQLVAERLKRQLATLLEERVGVAPDRLAAEVALLAARADATEELDRLRAHVTAARDLLRGGGPIGRKLDFLAQEFNREANTLTSKSGDIEVTRCGLAIKNAIEQFREQVQNIE